MVETLENQIPLVIISSHNHDILSIYHPHPGRHLKQRTGVYFSLEPTSLPSETARL